jgi:hypothetical protein
MLYPRETLKEAGYEYVRKLDQGTHLLRGALTPDQKPQLEIWANSKGYAGYALKYKNTELEFCGTYKK